MKNKTAVSWLSDVTGKKKIYILLLIIVQSVLGGSSVVYALFLKRIIDYAVKGKQHEFIINVAGIIGLVVFQVIMRAVCRRTEEKARSTFENQIKGRLFSSLLGKDYASVTSIHSGEWMNRLTNDSVVCAGGMVDILPGIAGTVVKLLGAVVMLIALEPKLAYIVVPGGFAMIFFTYGLRKIMKKLHKEVQEKDGKLRVYFQEVLSSLAIVRTYSAEKQSESEASEYMLDHQKIRMKRNKLSNISNSGFMLAVNGMYIIGLIYGGHGIMQGTLTYGTLTAMLQLIMQIQTPFANITGYMPKFYAMTASAERIILAEGYRDNRPKGVKSAEEVKEFYRKSLKSIGFRDLEFSYQPPKADEKSEALMPIVLSGISLEINKGEYIAFTGHSGCGKSTLLKLLMCLYEADSGERYMDCGTRIPLTSEWQRLFAYVPQGNQLMSGTIRDIVGYADKQQASDTKRIENALRIACADEFVSALESGAETQLGERGAGLSEGQMQRIAIARAIYSEAPILVLDEATSALDEITEASVLENLRSMTDKTVLIVTHRPKALEICDRILEFTENDIKWKEAGNT